MNREMLRKQIGKNVRLFPIAKRQDIYGRELPEVNYIWNVTSLFHNEITLQNSANYLVAKFKTDHIRDFRSDPNPGSDGLFILKLQITMKDGAGILFEPIP